MAAALTMAACAMAPPVPTATATKSPTLYQRLGGREGIRGVVDDFVANAAADDRIKARFAGMAPARVEKFKTDVSDQICEATGGPCSYLGRDMKTAHKGLAISEAEWSATVENLVKALDKRKVAEADRQELLGLLGPMKADIVGQ